MQDVIALFGTLPMKVILVLIAIDVVLGIIVAIVKKDFCLRKLADFMKGPILAYVLGFAVIEIVGQALPRLGFVLVTAVFVLVVIALLGSIIRNLGRVRVPLPGFLKK
ncbi:MAG: phage holin family protein [Candidatus Doudnabacteria bacterium]